MPAPLLSAPGLTPLGNPSNSGAAFYTHTPYAYMAVPDGYRTLSQPSPIGWSDGFQDLDASDGFRSVSHSFSSALENPASRVARSVADPFAHGMYYKPTAGTALNGGLNGTELAHFNHVQYNAQRPQMHHVPRQLQSNGQPVQSEGGRNLIAGNQQLRPAQVALNSYPNRTQPQPKESLDSNRPSATHHGTHPHPSSSVSGVDREESKASSNQRRGQANYKFHTPLNGICEFLPLSDHMETPAHWPSVRVVETDGTTVRAFIGQVRFETTAEQIAYIIEHSSGVAPAFVAYHRVGCFVAHFYTVEDCQLAVQYHKRIYFDTTGVWIAHSDEAFTAMVEEIEAVSSGPRRTAFRRRRLPRGGMVIEQFTDADPGSPMRLHGPAPTVPQTPRGIDVEADFEDAYE